MKVPEGWFTTSRYADTKISKQLPESEGVYMLFGFTFAPYKQELLYIGRSSNLKNRINSHPIINEILYDYDHYGVCFKETNDSIEYEKELINKYKPFYNIQYV